MKKIILSLLCLPVIGFCQNKDSVFIRQISDDIMLNGKAYEWLHYLTKSIGNRLTASASFYKAIDWGKKTLQKTGADTVTLQACDVVNWKRGKIDAVYISAIDNQTENIKLNAIALGNSLAGQAKASVITIKSFEELEQKKDEIKGKIVFFNNAFNPTYIETFRAYGESGKYRYLGPSKAAKYGAVGCLIRSLSGSTDNYPHTGMMKYNDSFPKIPCAALGLQDADKLGGLCRSNSVTVSITTSGYLLKDTIAYNVIGELKGSKNLDEIITVGGHLDSWDVGEGAHDDGAGIVQTIEILRVFKALHYKPQHTIRFVLFANEENGLAGGKKYAEEAVTKKEKHLFALESDAGGFTPRGFGFKMKESSLAKVMQWKELLLPYGCYKFDEGGGADINGLNEKLGVPVGELLPDSQRYFDIHHTNNDVFETVNKRELLLGAINMAALIYLIDKYGL